MKSEAILNNLFHQLWGKGDEYSYAARAQLHNHHIVQYTFIAQVKFNLTVHQPEIHIQQHQEGIYRYAIDSNGQSRY